MYTGWNNGMVIGHFRFIENLFSLGNFCFQQGFCKQFVVFNSFQNIRNFRIHIVAQISCIHTWISCNLLLIQTLDNFQRFVGRIAEFLIAFNLQRSQIEQSWSRFSTFFGRNISNVKIGRTNRIKKVGSFFYTGKPTFGSRKNSIAINGFQFPVSLRLEILNFQLTVHNQRQSRGLNPPNGKNLTVFAVFQCIKSRGIHAQKPIANSA